MGGPIETIRIVLPPRAAASAAAARREAPRSIPAACLLTRPPAPRTAWIELTPRCNYACPFCAQSLRRHKRGEMRWPLFTRLVGEMADAGVHELGLHYLGEPFLCDWLADAIGHAKARGIPYVFLATNGSLAAPAVVRACLEAGLDSLEFSLNFADAAQLRDVAGAPASLFRDVLENVKLARRMRDRGQFPCALIASSLRHADAQEERMGAVVAEILPYVDEHYWMEPHMHGKPHAVPCESLFTEAHVAFDGTLSACAYDPGPAYAMADLANVPFLEGWHSERFARLREAHLRRDVSNTICEACVAYS